jgi:hypothetical protein
MVASPARPPVLEEGRLTMGEILTGLFLGGCVVLGLAGEQAARRERLAMTAIRSAAG